MSTLNQLIGFSDHIIYRAVILELQFFSAVKGPGVYKLNTSLFKDINYVNLINDTINNSIHEYGQLNPHLKWEMIKINTSV